MDKEQLIKDVIRWIITTKNTEMLDESDVDLVYKDYVIEKVVNVPQADSVQPQLAEGRLENVLTNEEALQKLSEQIKACAGDNSCMCFVPNMGQVDVYKLSWDDVKLAMSLQEAKKKFDVPSFG